MGSITERGQSTARYFLTQFIFVCLFRVSCDLFAWLISPQFGRYGISVQGELFSWRFWTSYAVFLTVALSHSFFVSRHLDALDVGIVVLFLASYVPLSSAWWITSGSSQFFIFASIFWLCVYVSLQIMRWKRIQRGEGNGRIVGALALVFASLLIFLGVILLQKFGIPSQFGFESVYERRSEYGKWLTGGLLVYLLSWSVFVFSSYLFFVSKSHLYKILAVVYILFIYAISGNKIYVLLIPIFIFVNIVVSRRLTWIIAPLFAVGTFASVLFFRSGEIWLPSLVQRLLVLPADISFKYVDFFRYHLLYSYSFLSFFFPYEYAALPGKLIGSAFYSAGDNATAGFLVDVFINIGWFGLLPLIVFFVFLRNALPPAKSSIIVLPFLAQLLDTPLPTALLTGGGGLIIAVAFLISRTGRNDRAVQKTLKLDLQAS
ncbi:hypothetical protein ACWX0K_13190 [Nitrobacteraceae bacterium UC4446_H13]